MKYKIPSISALVAFECAARHCNFSRAAEELHTSQSAISRHIAELESRLGVLLFRRYKRRLSLSEQGEQYYHAIVTSLDNINAITKSISNTPQSDFLTIACSHEISHLFLMPRFNALQEALGENSIIRIMTYEYETFDENIDSAIDLVFTYQQKVNDPSKCAMVLAESVTPVCSPAFLQKHKSILKSNVKNWIELPFLLNTRKNFGWATWEDWFKTFDVNLKPNYIPFYNYIYLLEAAAAGQGLALGWRGLIDHYLESGTLVPAMNDYVEFDRALYAHLTNHGEEREMAKQCLQFFNLENHCK